MLYGHEGPVNAVAFNPRFPILASGGSDKTVRLWTLPNLNNRPIILKDHDRWVLSLAFSTSGDTLFAGTGNKTIYAWPTRSDFLSGIIKQVIPRPLTREEWEIYIGKNIKYDKYVLSPQISASCIEGSENNQPGS